MIINLAVELAGDLGYGVSWLVLVLTAAIVIATGFFVYVVVSTKSKHAIVSGFDKAKYELHKYHAERYWAVFVAALLIWLWIFGYNWMPPVAFSRAMQNQENVHTVRIIAGQWFWRLEDGGYGSGPSFSQSILSGKGNVSSEQSAAPKATGESSVSGGSQQLHVKAGETVKFVARTQDVNHGFSILSSDKSMDSPLMQMQVVPGYDNVFYYTFDKPGKYTIRCLEYCGWNHPFMTSQITIYAS